MNIFEAIKLTAYYRKVDEKVFDIKYAERELEDWMFDEHHFGEKNYKLYEQLLALDYGGNYDKCKFMYYVKRCDKRKRLIRVTGV